MPMTNSTQKAYTIIKWKYMNASISLTDLIYNVIVV